MKFYIIDEKASRQKEYGWGDKDFKDNDIIPIRDSDTLKKIDLNQIFQKENIICYHDSFLKNLGIEKEYQEIFDEKLPNVYRYITFGGGINITNITNNRAVLPVSSFYAHLDSFLKSKDRGYILEIIAYGENYEKEKKLKLKNMIFEELFSMKSEEILSNDKKRDILKNLSNDNVIREILRMNNTVLEIKNALNQWKI